MALCLCLCLYTAVRSCVRRLDGEQGPDQYWPDKFWPDPRAPTATRSHRRLDTIDPIDIGHCSQRRPLATYRLPLTDEPASASHGAIRNGQTPGCLSALSHVDALGLTLGLMTLDGRSETRRSCVGFPLRPNASLLPFRAVPATRP